jgi:integrase
VYRDNGKDACLSLLEDAVRRSPIGLRQTNKRTPPVPLAPPLRSFAALWAFCDVQRLGFLPERIVCRQNGLPWSPSGLSKVRERIHKDSGLDKSVTANMLRHTCAMWMKIGGVTAHEAANFLGCSITIMQERYGTWDPLSMYSAIDALTNAKKLKEAARRAKAEGIPF